MDVTLEHKALNEDRNQLLGGLRAISHKIIIPPSKKQKFLYQSGGNKSKFAVIVFTCPDKTCGACFKTEQGLAGHFGRSPTCASAGLKLLDLNTSIQNIQPENAVCRSLNC